MSLKQFIIGQFKKPHGLVGRFAGYIMAKRSSNIVRNEWTLELLDLKPDDHILEVGYGPGIAIEKAAAIITSGLIVGIDHSEAMLNQARQRNITQLEHGTVKLFLGSIDDLPEFPQLFDKIYSANVVQFLDDPVAVFKKLKSLLTGGGVIATTYMPRNRKATDIDAHNQAEKIVFQLKGAGFTSVRIETKAMHPVCAISVIAINEQ